MLTKAYPDYRIIAPFFFYQIMVKHTKRLATKSDFLFSPKSLWKYMNYNIFTNNEKNYKSYKRSCKLFKHLCKYYKTDININIQLCRYGFCHSSNLIEWLEYFTSKKSRKFLTRLDKFYFDLDLNYLEPSEAEKYNIYSAYQMSEEEYTYYYLENSDELFDIENYLKNYIDAHVEYLIICMRNLYVDITAIQNSLKEIYNDAKLKDLYPQMIPYKVRLVHVFEILITCLDMGVKAKVKKVLY